MCGSNSNRRRSRLAPSIHGRLRSQVPKWAAQALLELSTSCRTIARPRCGSSPVSVRRHASKSSPAIVRSTFSSRPHPRCASDCTSPRARSKQPLRTGRTIASSFSPPGSQPMHPSRRTLRLRRIPARPGCRPVHQRPPRGRDPTREGTRRCSRRKTGGSALVAHRHRTHGSGAHRRQSRQSGVQGTARSGLRRRDECAVSIAPLRHIP